MTVSIPNPELHAGEREVQVVHASLEAAIKAAPDRGVNGIASALEDWVSAPPHTGPAELPTGTQDAARKWVEKHGLLEELGPVLRQFQEVVMERSKQLRDWRGGEPVEEDPLSTPPPPLEERPRRGERLTVGADLVLEMCTRQLSGENKLKDRVDAYIGHVPEMTDAWVQGFVESHMS